MEFSDLKNNKVYIVCKIAHSQMIPSNGNEVFNLLKFFMELSDLTSKICIGCTQSNDPILMETRDDEINLILKI